MTVLNLIVDISFNKFLIFTVIYSSFCVNIIIKNLMGRIWAVVVSMPSAFRSYSSVHPHHSCQTVDLWLTQHDGVQRGVARVRDALSAVAALCGNRVVVGCRTG